MSGVYGIEFSQFLDGGTPAPGDIFVGLRSGLNTQFTYAGASTSVVSVANIVTQALHGFSVGQIVYFNGTEYALAQANVSADAEVIGVVETVININSFALLVNGYITTLSGLVAGGTYFLSDTVAGQLTLTEPTTAGFISKPLLIAVSNTSGYFFNFRGKVIPSPGFFWINVNSSLTMSAGVGYVSTGTNSFALPATADFGQIIKIVSVSSIADTFTITQGANQVISFNASSTTIGAGGSVVSTSFGAAIELLCISANTAFRVISSEGNFTTT